MKKNIWVLLMSLSASISFAVKPASTADVDAAAAQLQTQINAINEVINSIPAVAHPVGSCYGGGVVYYASSDPNAPAGQRGLIAAPTDAQYLNSFNIAWQTAPGPTVNTQKTYFTGESNTDAILGAGRTFPAAIAANSYTIEGDTCTECTNWYLPSQNEIATLYAQSTSSIALGNTTFWSACNGTTPGSTTSFWSSTYNTPSSVFAVHFISGSVSGQSNDPGNPANLLHVRAVRAF